MHSIFLPLLTAATLLLAPRAVEFDHSHAGLTAVLKTHLHGELVDYGKLTADSSGLDAYLKELEGVQPDEFRGWSDDQRFAFWTNAYNAYTLKLITQHYPLKSIKDIGGMFAKGPWDRAFIPLNKLFAGDKGKALTLNQVEHEILRKDFKDARVHAAVNCASQGCPPLAQEAFVASKLNEQLEAQVKAWVASDRNVLDQSAGKLKLSKIFDWFEEDFIRDAGSVRAWVAKYAPDNARAWLSGKAKVKVSHLDYSWKLNDYRTSN